MGATRFKVSRQDWLDAARETLVTEGAGEVKVLGLAARLGVSRSSFYWNFTSHGELLDALLDDWEARNTAPILAHCARPSATITAALCSFFQCFLDGTRFDPQLDFAIREWARRDGAVRARIDAADTARLEAVTAMYARHDYAAPEADIRARILYFMQIGYHALELQETMEARMGRVAGYLEYFTGVAPSEAEVAEFTRFAFAQ